MDKEVIPSDQVLENLFNSMPPTRLGIAIGIANETSYEWSGTNVFFFSGKPGRRTLPEFVRRDQVALFTATKTNNNNLCCVALQIPTLSDSSLLLKSLFLCEI